MRKIYYPKKIESVAQEYWDKKKIFKSKEIKYKKKYYCLSMLPYPSGNLHMGHIRNYTIGDVISRYQRMLGKNVLQPIGWDAFGLPAENAAIKKNITPKKWTYTNISNMKNQLKLMGFSYDWSREITTCDPEYYRWEQWFFIYLYKKKMIYKKTKIVNWCYKDKTVLANEQVINGNCWRCDTKITLKKLPQWFIKITDYAEELLTELNNLKYWPEKVKTMQRNWIGKSNGIEIIFKIKNMKKNLKIYTNKINILMGVTYIILTINHPLSKKLSNKNKKINNFIKKNKIIIKNKYIIKQIGIFTKLYAIHPFNKKLLPIWISNFIDINENINSIMAIPAHNKNDLKFAYKYSIPIKPVMINENKKNFILFNSKKFNELNLKSAFNIINNILLLNKKGYKKTKYKLHDWNISRQRYWGAPIPIITLENGEKKTINEKKLPVILPNKISNKKTNNFLKNKKSWLQTTYKGKKALRETDTFDTFMESSWYYARYTCPNYKNGILDPIKTKYWLPIDQYIGGIEHAIIHLLYFRFYHKLLRDAGFVNTNEPAKKLLCQGMVLSNSFYYINNNKEKIWISPEKINIKKNKKNKIIEIKNYKGKEVICNGMSKMSKSRNNGINPKIIINKYGADTLRLFIIFAAPIEMELEWNQSGIEGANRFLKRIWKLIYEYIKKGIIKNHNYLSINSKQKNLIYKINSTINNVTNYFNKNQKLNIAISEIMKLVNKLKKFIINNKQDRYILQKGLITVIKLLYPFTPHICFYLWKILKNNKKIDNELWPKINKKIIEKKEIIIIIQINGKMRSKIYVKKTDNKEFIINYAKKIKKIKKYINEKKIKKIIYIPNKVLNILINN